MISASQIAEEFFSGSVTEWWVRKNVAPDKRLKLGHSTVRWFANDVEQWLQGRAA